jgi:hypothetical protein
MFLDDKLNFAEPGNILPEWANYALQDKVLFYVSTTWNEKGYTLFNVNSVIPVSSGASIEASKIKTPIIKEENKTLEHIEILCQLLNIVGDSNLFTQPLPKKYTPEQKLVLKQVLTPCKEQLTTNILVDLTIDDIHIVFNKINYQILTESQAEKIKDIYTEFEILFLDDEEPF